MRLRAPGHDQYLSSSSISLSRDPNLTDAGVTAPVMPPARLRRARTPEVGQVDGYGHERARRVHWTRGSQAGAALGSRNSSETSDAMGELGQTHYNLDSAG